MGNVRMMSALEISTEKESSAKQPQVPEIPDKLYFPIREAARIIGVEPYVLRFWEKEFPTFHPGKGGSKAPETASRLDKHPALSARSARAHKLLCLSWMHPAPR